MIQQALVEAMYAAVGPAKLIVVLVNGGQQTIDWIKHNVPTVVEAFEGGQSGGQAVAELLAGEVAPSGVLPYTLYPEGYLNQVVHQDMSMRNAPGRSYRFYTGQPLWPFGHSGSYTTWELAWAEHLPSKTTTAGLEAGVELSVTLRNTGRVDSAKALLFFVSVAFTIGSDTGGETNHAASARPTSIPMDLKVAPPAWKPPLKELFAIKKVFVPAGGSLTVEVSSSNVRGLCAFCTVDGNGDDAVRPGSYTITVGDGSGSDIEPMVTLAV